MPRTEWSGILRGAAHRNEVGVFPVGTIAEEEMRRVGKLGAQALISTRTPRNILQHRLLWALAQMLADSVEGIQDREEAVFILKVRARYGDWVADPITGETHFRPGSIAFDALSQEEFSKIFDRFIAIICQELVPGLAEETLRKEILDAAGGDLGRRAARGGRGIPNDER